MLDIFTNYFYQLFFTNYFYQLSCALMKDDVLIVAVNEGQQF